MNTRIAVDADRIAEYCRKWKITEFSFFGSVLRDDFGPESDIDVLVTFASDAPWTLFDLVHMEDELKEVFGRDVDLVTREGLEGSPNYLRRRAIFSSAEVIHAAGH